MSAAPMTRRSMLGASLAAFAVSGNTTRAVESADLHIATNQYSWHVFYQRAGRNFTEETDVCFAEIAACGIHGFEGNAGSPEDVKRVAPLLKKHGLEMRSLYVNSELHDLEKAKESVKTVIAIAEEAKKIGTSIIVTNPSPIRWGGDEAKSDRQLVTQAHALNEIGFRLKSMGMTLAYHNHDAELRHAAREFHHMMVGTDPNTVSLCLDSHWIYRGAGDSQQALFDIVELYGERISELHLRQSQDGVWTEAFCPGDISYERLVKQLLDKQVKPHIVLEVAVEQGTPNTLSAKEAHQKSVEYALKVLAALSENGSTTTPTLDMGMMRR